MDALSFAPRSAGAVPPSADTDGPMSPRQAAALATSQERALRRRSRLRPVLWIVLATVLGTTLTGRPRPGLSGHHLAVTAAIVAVCLTLGLLAADLWPLSRPWARVTFPLLAGACGLLLEAVQPSELASLPTSVSVLTAMLYLPRALGVSISGALAACLALEVWLVPGGSPAYATSELAFCAALGLMALSMQQAGQDEARAEVLLARLEDAREAEALAVVLAERTRIARDLHDVLAQSLSGLAIQLEGARRLARHEEASEQLQMVIERAGGLVKDGLAGARQAVSALRDGTGPALGRLPELVERYRLDHSLDARLCVEGTPRELPPETGLALYLGTQEALTNAARYAHGSQTTVTLRYEPDRVALTVEDRGPGRSASVAVNGAGHGLIGMRERLAQVGGSAVAGPRTVAGYEPDGQGWSVRMEVAG